MFETSRGNGWLVSMMAEHLERPRHDLALLRGLQADAERRRPQHTKTIASGVISRTTAGIENYHTPLDTLAAAIAGPIGSNHGDHVLSMTRAFADSESRARSTTGRADLVRCLAFGISVAARLSTLLALDSPSALVAVRRSARGR